MSQRNIVFDVGRVLIDFRYDDFFVLLRANGAQFADETDFADQVGLIPYEHGEIGDDEFIDRLSLLVSGSLTREALAVAWNDIFNPIDGMLDFARQLSSQCQVFLLSNTSSMHWQHLQKTYGLSDLCVDLVASYELGVMKPDAGIYRACEERFGVAPEDTIFVDDKRDNVQGALMCGWQGHHHTDIESTQIALTHFLKTDA